MWAQVRTDLENLLSASIYPALMGDAVYRAFLTSTGAKLSDLSDYTVPAPLRDSFRTAAKIRAYIIVAEIEKSQAIREESAGAKVCRAVTLYRLWDAGSPERRQSVWWFEPTVIECCKKSTPRSADARKQWLREHLAVSIDWSKLNRVDTITLSGGDGIPAIVGIGKPMPVYSQDAVSTKVSPGSNRPLPVAKTTPEVYFDNFGKFFPGGIRQTILPFIPRATGMDLNAFLNKG
jgi:hypothetical protein